MFKVLKEFIVANGFKGEVGQEVDETKLLPNEINSLVADGSLEELSTSHTGTPPTPPAGESGQDDVVPEDKGQEDNQANLA